MIRSRKITPEEKLLHIIEKPEEIDKLKINMKNRKDKLSLLKSNGPAAIFGKIDLKKISLRGVNKILIWLSIIVTLSLIAYFIRGERLIQIRLEDLKKEGLEKGAFSIAKRQKHIPDLSSYISETEKNNPFHVLPITDKAETEELEQKIDLTLVGIIWSHKPQAIIEDTVSKKNFLVYEGDTVDKYKIIEINQTEVKLTSEDGEKTLR